MGLNKSVGNMYDWVSHTWNPVTGCKFGCKYCYAQSQPGHDTPKLHKKRLKDNLGEGNTIFVGSMADMWGHWVPDSSILHVLYACRRFDKNTYLFQSKDPRRFHPFLEKMPDKVILGTTIETNRLTNEISLAPQVFQRALALATMPDTYKREVTIEPILDFDIDPLLTLIKGARPTFVAVGADSKGHGLKEPSAEKVKKLIAELCKFTQVKIKANLERIYPGADWKKA